VTVVFLTASVSHSAGGLFDAVRGLAGSLRDNGDYPVQVFGLHDRNTEADRGAWGDVPVRTFEVAGPAAFGFAPGLERALEAAHPEIVHVHGLWMYPSVVSLRWAKSGSPYIVSPHGMLDPWAAKNSRWKKRFAGALYENRHLRGAACLHALNQAEADAFRAYGLRNPVCVIPNGVETPASRPTVPAPWEDRLPKDARVLFYIGRLHPKKGLRALLQGWSTVQRDAKRSGWQLVIAGWDQDGHEQELRALASTLGLNESAHFVGPQFGELKAACFHAAGAFILPSVSEGLPMTVLEAWAYGLPVLMTPRCNLPEGQTAHAALVMEPDADSIAQALRRLFSMSEAERESTGARGRRLVEERYLWSEIAQKMAAVYDWVLGTGPRPGCILN
jgi:poly(glycerol-phosphate) alpha-glucosyltransferase